MAVPETPGNVRSINCNITTRGRAHLSVIFSFNISPISKQGTGIFYMLFQVLNSLFCKNCFRSSMPFLLTVKEIAISH